MLCLLSNTLIFRIFYIFEPTADFLVGYCKLAADSSRQPEKIEKAAAVCLQLLKNNTMKVVTFFRPVD